MASFGTSALSFFNTKCVHHLLSSHRRKSSLKNPNMKMVISMSFGVAYPNEFAAMAIKSLTAERKDVLWMAAAGNKPCKQQLHRCQ